MKTTKDISNSGIYCDVPGKYHVIVMDARAPGTTKGGVEINGAICVFEFGVLAGPEGTHGKKFSVTIFRGDSDFVIKKYTRTFLALDLLDKSELGEDIPDKEIERRVNEQAKGKQCLIEMHQSEYQGKTRFEMKFANIYHMTDPDADDFPRHKTGVAPVTAPDDSGDDDSFEL